MNELADLHRENRRIEGYCHFSKDKRDNKSSRSNTWLISQRSGINIYRYSVLFLILSFERDKYWSLHHWLKTCVPILSFNIESECIDSRSIIHQDNIIRHQMFLMWPRSYLASNWNPRKKHLCLLVFSWYTPDFTKCHSAVSSDKSRSHYSLFPSIKSLAGCITWRSVSQKENNETYFHHCRTFVE